MPKAIIAALIVVGFLLFIVGFTFSRFLMIIGLILICTGLYLGLGPDGILRKDQILV